jgi:ubiquinone/menaquinone biosynthesis C-methylase UbiE
VINDVRDFFNRESHSWGSKYGTSGKLNSRLEQFTVRLSDLTPPPARILDLGCGTGDLAAAIGQMGYQVTACDIAEEMIGIARTSHEGAGVDWIWLQPDWQALPFADNSFDGVVASSVFEYLGNAPRVAGELSRVLKSRGSLLLTVPNPFNLARKVEAWLRPVVSGRRLSSLLRRMGRLDSYVTYLQLSRNRFAGDCWQSILGPANFSALGSSDFSEETWRGQAKAPLVFLALRKIPTSRIPVSREITQTANEGYL